MTRIGAWDWAFSGTRLLVQQETVSTGRSGPSRRQPNFRLKLLGLPSRGVSTALIRPTA